MNMRTAVVAGVLGAGLVALAGCGSASSSGTSNQGGSAQGGGGSEGGTIVMAVNSLPDNLTSVPWGGVGSALVLNGLGSQLTRYDTTGLEDGG
jgi:hypothetical protein